jgi:hypothetical protein
MGNIIGLGAAGMAKKTNEGKQAEVKSSNVEKTLKGIESQKRKKNTSLYLDREVYEEAQRVFGIKKVSAIVEAALKDILEDWKRQNQKDNTKKGA